MAIKRSFSAVGLCLAVVGALAACSSEDQANASGYGNAGFMPVQQVAEQGPPPPVAGVASANHAYGDWAGLWTAQEGLFVKITPTNKGEYTLEMQGAEDKDLVLTGRDSKGGIAFTRDGKEHVLRRATGEEIGLRYSLDKPIA